MYIVILSFTRVASLISHINPFSQMFQGYRSDVLKGKEVGHWAKMGKDKDFQHSTPEKNGVLIRRGLVKQLKVN